MPVGMFSRQKAIGFPITICSMPARFAHAAVANPYGPAPITKSGTWARIFLSSVAADVTI